MNAGNGEAPPVGFLQLMLQIKPPVQLLGCMVKLPWWVLVANPPA